jgi:hypothetical protein
MPSKRKVSNLGSLAENVETLVRSYAATQSWTQNVVDRELDKLKTIKTTDSLAQISFSDLDCDTGLKAFLLEATLQSPPKRPKKLDAKTQPKKRSNLGSYYVWSRYKKRGKDQDPDSPFGAPWPALLV